MPTKILEIMKKIMFLGLFLVSLSVMSFTTTTIKTETQSKPKLVTHTCDDGYTFEYFKHESFTQADYDEMINEVCSEDHGQ